MEFPSISRTVEDVFKDFSGRRNGIICALTHDVDVFYALCNPDGENLCLYAYEDGSWKVSEPEESVPPGIPQPATGINFTRDGLKRKEWLSLIAAFSDSWLLSVSFYFGAHLNGIERRRLFSMINDLPTVFEVVAQRKQGIEMSVIDSGSESRPSTKRLSDGQVKGEDDEERSETRCVGPAAAAATAQMSSGPGVMYAEVVP